MLEGESELIDGVLGVDGLEGVEEEEDLPPPQFIAGSAKTTIQKNCRKRMKSLG